MDLRDFSVDPDVHNCTQIHRLSFGAKGATRVDALAFQPQDFAEEWLTRPWSEMQSRSAGLSEWHAKLHGDFVSANYSRVVSCGGRLGDWLIALNIARISAKELSEPRSTYSWCATRKIFATRWRPSETPGQLDVEAAAPPVTSIRGYRWTN